MYKEEEASVFNPSHYRSHPSGVECIDIIRNMPFSQGNAIKYCWRAGMKDEDLQDLTKALWYINDCIENKVVMYNYLEDPKMVAMFYQWFDAEPAGYRKLVITYLVHRLKKAAKLKLEEWIESIKEMPS